MPVHTDAAHGGMLLLSPRHRDRLAGIERSDTVTIDPHKILGVNQPLGFLGVRDQGLLDLLGKMELRYYLRDAEADLGDWSMDNSRSLDSLGAWIMMRSLGRSGYARLVDHFMDLAARFAERLRASGVFEIVCPNDMNVMAYRFRPADLNDRGRLNELNERLFHDVMASREFAISRYIRANGDFCLRSVFVNPATTAEDVEALATCLLSAAANLRR